MDSVRHDMLLSPWEPNVFSLVVYGALVCCIIAALLFISSYIGEKKKQGDKLLPYESGIIPSGQARLRYPVHFYLVAIFFLLFDVEGAYLFSWAITWERLGWTGWFQIAFFILILLAGLAYVWNKQGLEWGVSCRTSCRKP